MPRSPDEAAGAADAMDFVVGASEVMEWARDCARPDALGKSEAAAEVLGREA
jgi:hypothetical protein